MHLGSTTKHKLWVFFYLLKFSVHLIYRGLKHDLSKYSWIEAKGFAETILKLKNSTYGSEEYKGFLKQLKPSLDHHYKMNSHHPEHYYMKFPGMNMYDLVELWCDWLAAVRRHKDGDIIKSIENNEKRFNIPKELSSIFVNTVKKRDKNGKRSGVKDISDK